MIYEDGKRTVIMLTDGRFAEENDIVERWLSESRFSFAKTKSLNQALEEISDFTTDHRPDVVVLELQSIAEQFETVKKALDAFGAFDQTPVFVLSGSRSQADRSMCFEGDLAQIGEQLDRVFPKYYRKKAARH